jgi:hypothetical protein
MKTIPAGAACTRGDRRPGCPTAGGDGAYPFIIALSTKRTFAGRSANRRMK